MNTCGMCQFWNFKVGADKNFGECLNPKVAAATRISTVLCDFGEKHEALNQEVKTYARIQFEENTFGCIHFENNSLSAPLVESEPYAG